METEEALTSAGKYYAWLRSLANDRGAQALSKLGAVAKSNGDLEILGPSLALMTLWGRSGYEMLVEIAAHDEGVKRKSQALKLLSTIAAGRPVTSLTTFFYDQSLIAEINIVLSDNYHHDLAKHFLADLIMTVSIDDLLIPIGTAFTQIALDDPAVAGELVAAIGTKWLKFGRSDLALFESLLLKNPGDEPKLHEFLEKYPQVLDPMALQVWSKPDFHGFREPDFLIRRSDDTYVVVEIENASKPLMTQADQPSAFATQAVKQVNDYRSFLEERIQEARIHFPNIHSSIDALVVIGLERPLSPAQAKGLMQENLSRSRTRIVGFDWLLQRARSVLDNVTGSEPELIRGYRVI